MKHLLPIIIGLLCIGSTGYGQVLSVRQFDDRLSTLSEQIAVQMARYPTFCSYIKETAGERFDGDYNFLLERHLQDWVEPEKTLQAILLEGLERPDDMLSFLQSYKQLQMAVPHRWAAWNGREPLSTVFIPADYEEHLAKTVQGFSPAGFPIQLSVLEALAPHADVLAEPLLTRLRIELSGLEFDRNQRIDLTNVGGLFTIQSVGVWLKMNEGENN